AAVIDFLYHGRIPNLSAEGGLERLPWLLSERTIAMVESALGTGDIPPVMYNAIYKQETVSWLIRGRRPLPDGGFEPVILSVEQGLDALRAGGLDAEVTDWQLVPLSPRAVRTLLGEQGSSAFAAPIGRVTKPSGYTAQWTGSWTADQLARLPRLTQLDVNGEWHEGT